MTNRTILFRILAMILSILTLTAAVAFPASAAEVSTVYIEDTFEQYGITNGNVTDKSISADYAGSTNYAIVKDGALSGNRSVLVNDYVDWRWWARSITTEKLTMEYKLHIPVGSSVTFTACMTLDGDSSTSNEGLGGAIAVVKGNETSRTFDGHRNIRCRVRDFAPVLVNSLDPNVRKLLIGLDLELQSFRRARRADRVFASIRADGLQFSWLPLNFIRHRMRKPRVAVTPRSVAFRRTHHALLAEGASVQKKLHFRRV